MCFVWQSYLRYNSDFLVGVDAIWWTLLTKVSSNKTLSALHTCSAAVLSWLL